MFTKTGMSHDSRSTIHFKFLLVDCSIFIRSVCHRAFIRSNTFSCKFSEFFLRFVPQEPLFLDMCVVYRDCGK